MSEKMEYVVKEMLTREKKREGKKTIDETSILE